MMKIDWKIVWESVKEPLREMVMAIIPFLLVHFQTINTEWAVIVYLVLRGIDAYLHKSGVAEQGLTRF